MPWFYLSDLPVSEDFCSLDDKREIKSFDLRRPINGSNRENYTGYVIISLIHHDSGRFEEI